MARWKLLVAFAAIAVISLTAWVGPSAYKLFVGHTTGSIYVSGPQVYTRERLVNDRYREDTWLLGELDGSSKLSFGATASLARTASFAASIAGSIGTTGPQPAPSETQPASNLDKPTVAIDVSPFDRFHSLRTYREQIRTLIIENQLDDRHDLRGNSLYRLRFDAAVLPGSDTRASAKITVSVLPPEGLLGASVTDSTKNQALRDEETKLARLNHLSQLNSGEQKAAWERIYLRWLDSLEKRFEDGRKDLRKAYDMNRFAPGDYDILVDSARSAVHDWSTQITTLKAKLDKASLLANLPADVRELFDEIERGEHTLTSIGQEQLKAIEKFRDDYSHGTIGPSMMGHQVYKSEINRLIGVVNRERALWAFLDFTANPPSKSITTSPPGNPVTTVTQGADSPDQPISAVVRIDDMCGDLETYGTYPPIAPPYVDFNLSYFMDKAFEGKLAKSVLGLQPDPSQAGDIGTSLKNLKALARLAIVEQRFGAIGPAFLFKRQSASLVSTDTEACIPDNLKPSLIRKEALGRTVFVLTNEVNNVLFLVPGYDLQADIEALAKDWGPPIPPGQHPARPRAHVVTNFVEAGLINFIRAAGGRLDAFSYAFTPSEPDELVATRSLDEQSRTLATQAAAALAGTQGSGGARIEQHSGVDQSRNALRKLVVGFGEQTNSAIATFGWVIQPQEPIEGSDYRQRASQTSLTALISLPAWWEEIRVKIRRSWTNESSKPELAVGTDEEYTIELPVNFETVDASLFEMNDRSPAIHEWATEGVIVKACEKAEIVIPGRRLWRSTVVTLGGQKADEIFVLPDMNGIIATFKPVQFPSTWSNLGEDFEVPLTVWTSQGSASLPIPATFHQLGANAERGCDALAKGTEPKL